jgi:hypothetical protein
MTFDQFTHLEDLRAKLGEFKAQVLHLKKTQPTLRPIETKLNVQIYILKQEIEDATR